MNYLDDEYKNTVVVNGVTFNKGMDKLIRYSENKKGSFYSVPESVLYIEDGAFFNCKNLTSIFIPDCVHNIGYGAFKGCDNLKNIIVSQDNTEYMSIAGKLYDKDGKRKEMEITFLPDVDYVIPKKITSITGIENRSMGNGDHTLDSMCEYRSSGNDSDGYIEIFGTVKSVTLHKNVSSIKSNLFYILDHVEYFAVDERNPYFKSIDGVLFSRDGKRLIAYPAAKPDSEYTVPDGVEIIEERAFSECRKLSSVNFPDSLIHIGRYAFNATSLTKCILPPKLKWISKGTFEDCTLLANIRLPEGLKVIDEEAFVDCCIESINLPESLEVIGINAFIHCNLSSIRFGSNIHVIPHCAFAHNNLQEIDLGHGVEFIGRSAFEHNSLQKLIIPDNVKSIDDSAFKNCQNLEEVHIGSGLRHISLDSFIECGNLAKVIVVKDNPKYESIDSIIIDRYEAGYALIPEAVKIPNRVITEQDGVLFMGKKLFHYPAEKQNTSYTIPDWVESIESFAFLDCTHLEEIILSATIKRLSSPIFSKCKSIRKVIIPEGVTRIGNDVFYQCENLSQVVLPSTLEVIGECTFADCGKLKEIKLPEGLEWIGTKAFFNCSKLKTVNIPGSVRIISEEAFRGCRNLKSLTICNGVSEIEQRAFASCENLTEVHLPNSVTCIRERAFERCSKLKKLVLPISYEAEEAWLTKCENLSEITFGDGEPVTQLQNWFFTDLRIDF